MKQFKLKLCLPVILLIFFFIFFIQFQNQFNKYSVFAMQKESIEKYQILSMPWQKLNGPFGGQGYTIRFRPDNNNIIFVTDSFAGIHISNDRGLTWEESVQGIDSRTGKSGDSVPVFVTTIDPNNPERIWCGVKNAMGVFLSTDGGMTWQHKDNGLPGGAEVEIRGLAVKPGNSNIVFAAGDLEEMGPFMGAFQRTQGIVYRTKDGGENWEKVLEGGNLFKDIIIDPNNPDTIYVASGFFDRHELTRQEGVYKSTDSGDTWTQINNGIRNLYVTTLKFDPVNPNVLWGTTGMLPQFDDDTKPYDGSIIVSRDGGMSWTEAKRGRSDGNKQTYSALGISPTNPKIIYAGAFGIFIKSTDGGMTWKELGWGPLGSNPGHPVDITVDPNNENIVYVDSYIGGVFKSTDKGETWVTNAFGYSGSETRGVAVSSDGQTVFATGRAGVFLSQDKGVNWIPAGIGDVRLDELQAIAPHPTDNNKILLGDSQNAMNSIFLSTDGGMIWKTVFMLFAEDYSPTPSSTDLKGEIAFTGIKWSKSNPNIAFASCVKKSLDRESIDSIGWGVFKSSDGGTSWVNKQKGIPGFKNTWAVDIDPKDENIVYIATNDAGILKSTDGGENWTQINNGFGDLRTFTSIAVSPVDTMILLAGSADGQIFRSENNGESWSSVLSDIREGDNIVSIVFNPVASTNQIYAATPATGVYVSGDNGITWQPFNDGLSVRDVTDLTVTPDGSAVYAATNGGGIFRLPITGEALTLTRKQIEIPSNVGIDATNNSNPELLSSSGSSSTTSSGGIIKEEFILKIDGPALNGITLNEKKSTKTFLVISLSEPERDLNPVMVSISSNFPSAVKLVPKSFSLTSARNNKKVFIIIPSLKRLKNLFTENPGGIILNITQSLPIATKEIEIPIIVKD